MAKEDKYQMKKLKKIKDKQRKAKLKQKIRKPNLHQRSRKR
jgi:hypothetical protein